MPSPIEQVVILHGTKGSADGNWFPWLAAELRSAGVVVTIPQLPTPEGQSLENWQRSFTASVGEIGSGTTVIGHSNGAVFLLRLLERAQVPIRLAVFVAGFCGPLGLPEYDLLNSTFVDGPFDWTAIIRNAPRRVCLIGEHDPYVPEREGRRLAAHLGVRPQVIANGGHLNAEAGFHTFPQLRTLLREEGLAACVE